jgi:hypothetical protein
VIHGGNQLALVMAELSHFRVDGIVDFGVQHDAYGYQHCQEQQELAYNTQDEGSGFLL